MPYSALTASGHILEWNRMSDIRCTFVRNTPGRQRPEYIHSVCVCVLCVFMYLFGFCVVNGWQNVCREMVVYYDENIVCLLREIYRASNLSVLYVWTQSTLQAQTYIYRIRIEQHKTHIRRSCALYRCPWSLRVQCDIAGRIMCTLNHGNGNPFDGRQWWCPVPVYINI